MECASCFSNPLQVLGCVTGLQEWWYGVTQLFCGCETVVLCGIYSINKRPTIEYTRRGQGCLHRGSVVFFIFFFLTEILFFEFLMSSGCKADMYHVKQKALAPQPRGLRFLQHKVTSAFSASTDFQVKRSKKLPAPHPAMELTQPLQRWLPECGSLWKCVFTRRGHGCLSFLYPRPQPSFSSLLPSRLLFFLCQPVPDTVPGAED